MKLEEIKLERNKAKKNENEAFARRVEEGGCTELERARFELALAQAKVRKIQDEQKVEKKRSKAEPATATTATTGAASTTEPAAKRSRGEPAAPGIGQPPMSAGSLDAQPMPREELWRKILVGYHPQDLAPDMANELLKWAEERVRADDPHEVVLAGRRQKLPHLKLMFGIPDENGQLPLYNFGLTTDSWKRVAPMPELLRQRADQICKNIGTKPNSCMVNFYNSGEAFTAVHQDQAFSDCGGKIESKLPVVIDRVGVARDLGFHELNGDDLGQIRMQHADSYELTGETNVLSKHSVPACEIEGLCVSFSWRFVRNSVIPDGTFAIMNGNKRPLAYLERALGKEARYQLQKKCEERGLETMGSKADLVGRLAALAPVELRALEVVVLAGGHTPDAPVVMRVLRVQGAELAALMLIGDKIVENRKQLGLGWWVLYVGKDRQWRDAKWAKPFKKVLGTVPSDESLNEWYGHAVGMTYLSEYRSKEECHGYRWAGGEPDQVCHVVSHAISFGAPVAIKTPKMNQQPTWEIEPDEEAIIRAQLADGSLPTRHDLRPINEPQEEAEAPARASGSSSDSDGRGSGLDGLAGAAAQQVKALGCLMSSCPELQTPDEGALAEPNAWPH